MPYARTKFQWFMSDPPLSPFKKLIVSTPRLLHSLYMMSLAKAVPDGLKDRKCKKSALCERPPIPYVPKKDCVQETVSAYKDNHLKTQIGEGMELRVLIWHSGMREAFLIHVGSAQEAIEKKGYFKAYEENKEAYVKLHGKIKSAKAQLATLDESAIGETGTSKKSKKTQEAAAANDQVAPALQAEIEVELSSAQEAATEAKNRAEAAANDMFQLYANLLSIDAKYAWDKIVHEQTASDPYTDLQGCTKKGPRGLSRKSFDDCVIFYLLTVFPNNAAEQEQYYITNVLKKPQCVSIRQFVQRVEQLNSYISHLPCWYYSPSAKAGTIPMNVAFPEADLASHVLRMCPNTWQDQFNLHEKGLNPMDMRLLLQCLEAIERVCTQERANAQSTEKASTKNKKRNKRPGTKSSDKNPKKDRTEKHCDLCKKHGGTYTMHNTQECHRYEKNGNKKYGFRATKKGARKPNPTKQSFAQLCEKMDKLEKAIKKQDAKRKKRHRSNTDSDSE